MSERRGKKRPPRSSIRIKYSEGEQSVVRSRSRRSFRFHAVPADVIASIGRRNCLYTDRNIDTLCRLLLNSLAESASDTSWHLLFYDRPVRVSNYRSVINAPTSSDDADPLRIITFFLLPNGIRVYREHYHVLFVRGYRCCL